MDLDGGVISVPECVHLPVIPEPYYTAVVQALTKVNCHLLRYFKAMYTLAIKTEHTFICLLESSGNAQC